jgi:hypothetical protein
LRSSPGCRGDWWASPPGCQTSRGSGTLHRHRHPLATVNAARPALFGFCSRERKQQNPCQGRICRYYRRCHGPLPETATKAMGNINAGCHGRHKQPDRTSMQSLWITARPSPHVCGSSQPPKGARHPSGERPGTQDDSMTVDLQSLQLPRLESASHSSVEKNDMHGTQNG